jgi:hypothetical protein
VKQGKDDDSECGCADSRNQQESPHLRRYCCAWRWSLERFQQGRSVSMQTGITMEFPIPVIGPLTLRN